MPNFCCEKFAHEAGHLQAPVGGGLYHSALVPAAQFERDEDAAKGWNVNGCCGGGCYVVQNMMFCPYCGTSLVEKT